MREPGSVSAVAGSRLGEALWAFAPYKDLQRAQATCCSQTAPSQSPVLAPLPCWNTPHSWPATLPLVPLTPLSLCRLLQTLCSTAVYPVYVWKRGTLLKTCRVIHPCLVIREPSRASANPFIDFRKRKGLTCTCKPAC